MPKLTDPIQVGRVTVKNRLWAAPINSNHFDWWGIPTPRAVRLYEERARGGFGIVAVEGAHVLPADGNANRMNRLYHTKQMNGLNRIAEVISRWGAVPVLRMMASGRQSRPYMPDPLFDNEELTPLAPSSTTPSLPMWPLTPREMTLDDIEVVYEAFVRGASLAKRAHFAGILVHFSHGFMPQQFLSPWTNHRTDKYGIHEGRSLFCTELLQKIRAAAGPEFVIGVRLAATDGLDSITKTVNPLADPEKPFLTLEMVKNYARQIEEAGADYLDITAGTFEGIHNFIPPLYRPRGTFLGWSEEIKKCVDIPVVGGGKVWDRAMADGAIERGRVDAIYLGRLQLSDPDAPRKFFSGKEDDVRKCICCCYCMQRSREGLEVDCAINPELSSARMAPIGQSRRPRTMLVVGGGVAGMEVARVAALCGHDVSLYEKSDDVGGLVKSVSEMPRLYMRDLGNIVTWQKSQLKKLNVKVNLGQEVTPEILNSANADVVVLATGSYFDVSKASGNGDVIGLDAFLKKKIQVGERVAIVGFMGAEAAVSLAREGKKVTLLDERPESAVHSPPWMVSLTMRSHLLLDYLRKETNVTLLPSVRIKSVEPGRVVIVTPSGDERVLEVDAVIVAANQRPLNHLKSVVQGKAEVYEVGDCVSPGTIQAAISSAHMLVRELLETGGTL